jgi:hypothetical protein
MENLQMAPVWKRPLALARNFDRDIFIATHFQPGVPLSIEGGIYALCGLLLAWLTGGLFRLSLRGRRRQTLA